MSDRDKTTDAEVPVQVLFLLETGHFNDAAKTWSELTAIPLASASMLCLNWLDEREKDVRNVR